MNPDYQNQVGPNVKGSGFIAIYTNGKAAKIFYSPSDDSKSKALYGINYAKPDIPLPVREWITLPSVENVYVDYEVMEGGDIKICWSII
jgi:hypothetical protein